MRLKHDCIRDVLLFLEDNQLDRERIQYREINVKHDLADIVYTLKKLDEAGYIDISIQYSGPDIYYLFVNCISYQGHLFIDTIRDNVVWSTTKKITSKFASVSITMIENIASNVITNMINESMNIK